MRERRPRGTKARLQPEPHWYKDAIIYELRIRSFVDSDADGIGDFRGATQKLDYLHDLGVNVLWLLPFYPSPLKDDGYDIAGYTEVHPDAGTLQDFKTFLREAHARGLRVVTELVINHTSDQHPWFERARRAPKGSPLRDFYVWSDDPTRYREARIIFKDFEHSNWTWDPVAQAYYWHRFYAHQPDLNFDNPRVKKAVFQVLDFWMQLGVDGVRLDAIPYLFEREGTNCENLPECHEFLKELRAHMDARYPNRMLLAEANQWPEDAVAYFGEGDECHMAFHFPVMPRLFMGLRMEDRFPIVDILQQTPAIPEHCQWAMFLRNHDELTLEMVTDEERDYMYRVYAMDETARINLGIRRRLAPLLGNDRKRIELMNALLFSLPGTPVLYYGDEIGMGDNFYLGDRNGVRTPMQWTPDRNAGFSRANPQRLFLPVIADPEYNFETVNVETQQANPHSLLWWTKRLIALRRRYQAFGRGTLELLYPKNNKVLAFVRRYGDETILVVCNLSRFVQWAELDLAEFRGRAPIELFGRNEFPPIQQTPYFLTLGPHAFLWFSLVETQASAARVQDRERPLPTVHVQASWEEIFRSNGGRPGPRRELEAALPAYLEGRRWYAAKGRASKSVRIADAVPMPGGTGWLVAVAVEHRDGHTETYVLPLAYATGRTAADLRVREPHAPVALVRSGGGAGGPGDGEGEEGILYDALSNPAFDRALLDTISGRRRLRGTQGLLLGSPARSINVGDVHIGTSGAEQSNTSVLYGDRLMLKVFRRIEEGEHPELEIGRFLTSRAFPNTPAVAGSIEYQEGESGRRATVAILQDFVPNEGDAWQFTLDWLGRYFDGVLAAPEADQLAPVLPTESPLVLATAPPPELARTRLGEYLERADLLGQRTGELHLTLGSGSTGAGAVHDPAFAPEPFGTLYQRSLYQSMRNLTGQVFPLLRDRLDDLPPEVRASAGRVAGLEEAILRYLRGILERKLSGMRIRGHGDFHLGQVLHTGKDWVIIDFEGEPARPLSQRRLKRSPLVDVAGMLGSLRYAAASALPGGVGRASHRAEDGPILEPWARYWQVWASAAFLRGYLRVIDRDSPGLLPESTRDREMLLDVMSLEKTIYELGYELNHRPHWLPIPIRAILERFPQEPSP